MGGWPISYEAAGEGEPVVFVHGVLQAAAVEAFGRSGVYVTRERVMGRAAMVDLEMFLRIAEYLEEEGWIAEADADYGLFTITVEGLDEAMR